MWFPVTTIRLAVGATHPSIVFYEALLGVRAQRREVDVASFNVDSPPLALTIEARSEKARDGAAPRPAKPRPRFTIYVTEPHRVGEVAIALRRARIPLRLGDRGLSTHDPDGNEWSVVVGPAAETRPVEQESARPTRGP